MYQIYSCYCKLLICLVKLSSCATSKCNAVDTVNITPKDGKIIYMRYLGGHTSNPLNDCVLDLGTNSKQLVKEETLEIICWIMIMNSDDSLGDNSVGTTINS